MTTNDWIGVATVTLTLFALYSSGLAWLVGQNSRLRAETRRELESLEALMERGLDKTQTQVNQLRDGSATKPELAAVEQRLAATLNEFKAEARSDFAKISQKVDRLPAIEAHLASVSSMIEKIGVSLSVRG
ncbi:hypothetical protein [Acidisoma silvae]|uniref:Uncharacterized protein n=1 Tax=Acidisoma silvae TaxID=2802396 RepID=A0A964DXZ0_9PROT|nr:hypothetical protein [Acidisoma silvae]MCB8874785.1 hypothetical protein [Acidisoma silvae]